MSQNEFAKRLSGHGLSFYQTTVQRIENQERAVRLDEARVISEELGVPLERMVRDESGSYGELLNLINDSRDLLASIGNSNLAYKFDLERLIGKINYSLTELPEAKNSGQRSDLFQANRLLRRMQDAETKLKAVIDHVATYVLDHPSMAERNDATRRLKELKERLAKQASPLMGERGDDGEHPEAP